MVHFQNIGRNTGSQRSRDLILIGQSKWCVLVRVSEILCPPALDEKSRKEKKLLYALFIMFI